MLREFVIKIQDISEDGKDYDLPITPQWLQAALSDAPLGADEQAGAGRLRVHVQRSGADILVQGRAQARIVAECGRCLADVKLDVDAPLSVLFTAQRSDLRPDPAEQELTPEDLDREYFSGSQIVLDPVIRDHLVLELPMQLVCPEGCAEPLPVPEHVKPPAEVFDPKPGGVDPRLAVLKDLAAKMPRDKE